MLIRFCGGRGVSPTWKTGDAKVEAAGVAGGSGINILFVMMPPVFDPIGEPAPVFRVGGDIPTLTRPDASPDQTVFATARPHDHAGLAPFHGFRGDVL